MKLLWWFLELVVDLLGRSPRTHALLLAPGFERLRWWLGRRRAQRTAVRTARQSTGPDRDKILATMREFGTGYTYVITSYPPFLKGLLDDDGLGWSRYDVVCAFGGEGISEGMRDHVLRRARKVVGAYGASDLEISIAVETESRSRCAARSPPTRRWRAP